MEIEKKRETSWKIQLKRTDDYIEITSVEVSGVVRIIKLALINKDKLVRVEMQKEDFFKFLSLISAFKDVVIGEEMLLSDESFKLTSNQSSNIQDYTDLKGDLYKTGEDTTQDSIEDNDSDELNPEEWDPW